MDGNEFVIFDGLDLYKRFEDALFVSPKNSLFVLFFDVILF